MSLLLSSIVVAWTFTAPFRSDKPLFAWDKSDLPERAVPISKEILSDPEHAMSDEVFLSHVWQIEDDLQNEFRRRNQVPDDLPDHKEANQAAKETLQSYQQELDVLMKLNSKIEGGFAKGSPEYEAILDVRKRIEQADDLKATK